MAFELIAGLLGIGLDADVREWFDFKMPKTLVDPRLVEKALDQ